MNIMRIDYFVICVEESGKNWRGLMLYLVGLEKV